jgi:hypothetical protein
MTTPRKPRAKKDEKAALLDIVTKSITKNRKAVEQQLAQAMETDAVKVLKDLGWLYRKETEEKGGSEKAIVRIEFIPNPTGGA